MAFNLEVQGRAFKILLWFGHNLIVCLLKDAGRPINRKWAGRNGVEGISRLNEEVV